MSTSITSVVHLDAIDAEWLTAALTAAGTLDGGQVVAV